MTADNTITAEQKIQFLKEARQLWRKAYDAELAAWKRSKAAREEADAAARFTWLAEKEFQRLAREYSEDAG